MRKLCAETFPVARRKFRFAETMILRAVVFDFDGAHKRCDLAAGSLVELAGEAVEQAGAEGVSATGGVAGFADGRRVDVDDNAVGMFLLWARAM